MDELEVLSGIGSQAEFYLATMTGGTTGEGLTIKIDGQDAGSTKKYKILLTGREPPRTGDRVLVMKISGSYIVLGKIGAPGYWWRFTPMTTSDWTFQAVQNKLNQIYRMFNDTGIAIQNDN